MLVFIQDKELNLLTHSDKKEEIMGGGWFVPIGWKSYLIIIGFLSIALISVAAQERIDRGPRHQLSTQLEGEHELQRFTDTNPGKGSYALIFGSEESTFTYGFLGGSKKHVESKVIINFAWKTKDGKYQLSSLPFEKVSLNFADVPTPTIKFVFDPRLNLNYSMKDFMDYEVESAIITIRKSDWSPQVVAPPK